MRPAHQREALLARSAGNVYAHFGEPDIWPRGYPLAKGDSFEEMGRLNGLVIHDEELVCTCCHAHGKTRQQGTGDVGFHSLKHSDTH